MKRKYITAFAAAVLLVPSYVYADHRRTELAPEYHRMEEGEYPKEVDFADTVFNNFGHAVTESRITEINGTPSDEHEFIIKAGDRVSFVLKGSEYGVMDYSSESLLSWSPEGRWDICTAVRAGDGLYMIRRDADSYTMEVTDFGFDTDLSGLTCSIVMTLDVPAQRLCDASEISSLGEDLRSYTDTYYEENEKELKFDDRIRVRAEGSAHITPVSDPGMYTGDYMMQETDTVGFQFIFDPDASWTCELNGEPFEPDKISYLYSGVWEERPDEDYDAETLYYRTPSIVLVDSDLVERETTVIKEWKQRMAEQEAKKTGKKEEVAEEQTETAGPAAAEMESPGAGTERPRSGTLSSILLIAAAVCALIAAYTVMRSKKNS
ncbi:MAG: hypothetical protein K6G61_07530 [Solobacterium sp.]|nr:hypothetical protein [Solobacterium sp.]